jgi:hypothetical protein
MINSTSSSDRVLRPDGPVHHTPTHAHRGAGADRFSPENSNALQAALSDQPEIRPDVVARARVLAADPSYPSPAVLRQVGQVILGSPDPTEEVD